MSDFLSTHYGYIAAATVFIEAVRMGLWLREQRASRKHFEERMKAVWDRRDRAAPPPPAFESAPPQREAAPDATAEGASDRAARAKR